MLFLGDGLEPVRLADEAMSFVLEFNEANPSNRGRVSPHVITTMPVVPVPSFSVFVDAGCNSNGPTVWGIVFKNHDMIATFSASKYDDIKVDPVMAEALGVRWAIHLVCEQGLHSSVSIYSGATNVVDCIYNKAKIAAIEMVTQDCRGLLSSLPNVSVLFVRREQNVAHNLASLARLVGNRTWEGTGILHSFRWWK